MLFNLLHATATVEPVTNEVYYSSSVTGYLESCRIISTDPQFPNTPYGQFARNFYDSPDQMNFFAQNFHLLQEHKHDHEGASLIWQAADCGHTALLTLLLKENEQQPFCDINAQNIRGQTALWRAAYHGFDLIVSTLRIYGSNIHPCLYPSDGVSPLWVAAENKNHTTITLLAKIGFNPNECDKDGTSPLLIAAETHGDLPTLEALCKAGAKVASIIDELNDWGIAISPLCALIESDKAPAVEYLLSQCKPGDEYPVSYLRALLNILNNRPFNDMKSDRTYQNNNAEEDMHDRTEKIGLLNLQLTR